MSSLLSSFFGYFSHDEHSSPNPAPSSNCTQDEAESLILELLGIYGKLKARKCLKPCDEVDGLFGRLVDVCILNRRSEITEQVTTPSSRLLHWLFRV